MYNKSLIAVCLLLVAAPMARADGEVVSFKTSDGVRIEADYYAPQVEGDAKASVVILIHMYPADRGSWKPLIPKLHDMGFAVLAYDIRGNGGSTQPADMNLAEKYQSRDESLFENAWRDVAAAKKWLGEQKECDTSRLALVGASIGCSISLHYGSRDDAVKAIVCLSPGTNYFGVDSKAHIKACRGRQIMLIAPEAEYDAVKELIAASQGQAKGTEYPGTRKQHGTGMFHADYGDKVLKQISKFVGRFLARPESEEVKKLRQARLGISPRGPVQMSIKLFRFQTGQYPQSLEDLYKQPADPAVAEKWKGPYVEGKEIPKDPWGNPYGYRASGDELRNKDSFDLWSAGPDGKDGTEDDIANFR